MSALPGKKRCNDAVHVGNRNEVLAGIEDRNDIAYNLFVAALPEFHEMVPEQTEEINDRLDRQNCLPGWPFAHLHRTPWDALTVTATQSVGAFRCLTCFCRISAVGAGAATQHDQPSVDRIAMVWALRPVPKKPCRALTVSLWTVGISVSNQFIAIGLCVIVEARSFALSLQYVGERIGALAANRCRVGHRRRAAAGVRRGLSRDPGYKLRLRSLVPQPQFANVM